MSQDNTNTVEQSSGSLALPDQLKPQRIYLIPVQHRPFMPGLVQPVMLDKERWQATLERVSQTPHQSLGLVYVGDKDPNTVTQEDFPEYGCLVKVHALNEENGQFQMVAQGTTRFRIEHWLNRKRPFMTEVSYPEPRAEADETIRAFGMAIINTIRELLPLNPLYNEGLRHYLQNFSPSEPSPLTDFAAALTSANGSELQAILETVPLKPRMEKVLTLVKKELEVARLQSQISEEVNEKVSQHQREFFLREQLKIIQRELGLSKDDKTAEAEEFRERMSALAPPEPVQKRFEDELQKLSVLETGSPEYGVTRNYLDWLTSVPWGQYSDDNLDLQHARRILEAHHSGLDDVKDRIVEFLAVGALRGEVKGSIILLVGPPGVGKTSIGKSVADALGRQFYRFSLGGMRDEAEIKGHRRTYIGAMPGKLVQALKEAGTANPVIMLDEVDKLGQSFQGDPASALLEVLDPEQNQDFLDHYLDERLDLSHALFICTANTLDSIPGPLLDRMEVIRLSGYITEEKVQIARQHLWPRALECAGVKSGQLRISDSALRQIVEGYAREAGVRNLEKQLNKIIRKAAVKLLAGEKKLSISGKNLADFLGQPYFQTEKTQRGVGVVTGLAWTSMGGATLSVEASLVHSKQRGFKLTGQLGDVMKESAEIAYSYVASHLKEYGLSEEQLDEAFIHLHVPEGATPKDGPSAGITMATALLSLLLKKRLPRKVAMTGELTLTGQVLAVGGIREKVIAARRVGIREVILPDACQRDFNELPQYLKAGLTVHFASRYDDVFAILWGK
ncbi:ATP dependent PIM1 peptidase. Serine peptidase. MEROPS family S16 [Alcanivorax sp. DSM 26293]|uniref:endopeptidase La n=1 Tax=Alcanivorax sp. DSM 26293 TaxID=1798238 RepID=UPI00089F8A44|nr:endopeptidase La [Alcanivorax sp. DSM 26293]SEF64105.1 ATP dependent PIM1 peptidase. Serine peptidase. MEROPS family S16 [Alcanivorax sp. DSM 26293]